MIAADGTTSDSLASAVSVLGPERGMQLVEQTKGVEALIVVAGPEEPVTYRSSGFEAFLAASQAQPEQN